MCANKQLGFSLSELVIALAVLAILVSLAAPSFNDSMQNARLSSTYNNMIGALQLARSESVKRNLPVAVCARASDSNCGTDWNNGALVFVDDGATSSALDADEVVLRILPQLEGGATVSALGSATSSGTFIQRSNIRFLSSGTSSWRGGGAIQFCDARGTENMRAMILNLGGDIRRARADENGNIVTQWGQTLACGV